MKIVFFGVCYKCDDGGPARTAQLTGELNYMEHGGCKLNDIALADVERKSWKLEVLMDSIYLTCPDCQ